MEFSAPISILIGLSLNIPFTMEQQEQKPDVNEETVVEADEISSEENTVQRSKRSAYLVGPGDTLGIDVWAGQMHEESLSGEYFILSSGNLEMPLLGKLQVSGLSLEAITDSMQE